MIDSSLLNIFGVVLLCIILIAVLIINARPIKITGDDHCIYYERCRVFITYRYPLRFGGNMLVGQVCISTRRLFIKMIITTSYDLDQIVSVSFDDRWFGGKVVVKIAKQDMLIYLYSHNPGRVIELLKAHTA
jgi:hypothetical protein